MTLVLSDEDRDFLQHYGVKGMKWGVRRSQAELDRSAGRRPEGVSRRTNRRAKKDAKEHTQAKMFYGEGAGNRRKLIKAKVNERSKNPEYKKAFDHHVENTNMDRRARQATSKRRREDVKKGTGKTVRGVVNTIKGNPRNASAVATLVATGGIAAYKAGAHEHIAKHGKTAYSAIVNEVNMLKVKRQMRDFYKAQ